MLEILKYRLLSHICFGQLKKQYKQKYKNMLKEKKLGGGKITFAQFGEDVILESLFGFLFSMNSLNLKYLDIGANDPRIGSNTFYFYKRHGSGVLIEPNPYFFPLYKKYRPNDKAIHAGISFDNVLKSADYYDFGKEASGLNTFSSQRKNEVIKNYPLKKIYHIPLLNINEILDSMNGVDFISLDVEGLELEILKTLNFNKPEYRPKMFCIEANKENIAYGYESELVKFMKKNDYIVVADNYINLIFADIKQIRHNHPQQLLCGNTILKRSKLNE